MKAVFGKVVYLGDDNALPNSYVVFNGSRISEVIMSKPDCEIVGEYETITPAFIDPHSHIGIARAGEPDEDTNEEMDSILFDVDVLDSVLMDDRCFKESIEQGVLYSCVVPGSGNIVGGKTAVIRNYGRNTREAFICSAGIKCAVGHNPKSTTDWKGTRPSTRMGAVALLRRELNKAVRFRNLVKRRKKDIDEMEPCQEFILKVLERKQRLRIHSHRTDDMLAALRLAGEFNLDVVLDHASDVHERYVFDLLRQKGIPLIYGPLDAFPYKVELKNESWKNVRHVIDSKVKFTIMSDHPVILQRNLFLQTRFLRRFGVSKAKCISTITKEAAEILGIHKDLGTLKRRKLASFVCWNGNPFHVESYPTEVYAEGKVVFTEES